MKTSSLRVVFLALCVALLPLHGFGQKSEDDCIQSGISKTQEGNHDGAIADYSRAIELDPKLAVACKSRGFANYLNRNWTNALQDFSRYCELSELKQDYPPPLYLTDPLAPRRDEGCEP